MDLGLVIPIYIKKFVYCDGNILHANSNLHMLTMSPEEDWQWKYSILLATNSLRLGEFVNSWVFIDNK